MNKFAILRVLFERLHNIHKLYVRDLPEFVPHKELVWDPSDSFSSDKHGCNCVINHWLESGGAYNRTELLFKSIDGLQLIIKFIDKRKNKNVREDTAVAIRSSDYHSYTSILFYPLYCSNRIILTSTDDDEFVLLPLPYQEERYFQISTMHNIELWDEEIIKDVESIVDFISGTKHTIDVMYESEQLFSDNNIKILNELLDDFMNNKYPDELGIMMNKEYLQ